MPFPELSGEVLRTYLNGYSISLLFYLPCKQHKTRFDQIMLIHIFKVAFRMGEILAENPSKLI